MNPFRRSSRRGTTRLRIFVWALLITGACGMVAFGEPAEDVWLGMRNVIRSRPADGKITIVGLDEATFRHFGTETFSQTNDAALIDNLFAAGAKRVFFDRTYANPTERIGDKAFVAALDRHAGKVFLGTIKMPDPSTGLETIIVPHQSFSAHARLATLNGHITPFQLSAKLPYESKIGDQSVPSISAEISGVSGTADFYRPDFSIQMRSIPTVSFLDVINGKLKPDQLAGKDVIVGPTSPRSHDYQRIVGQAWMPAVYFHAVGAQTLREGPPRDLGWIPPYLVAIALAIAMLAANSRRQRQIIIASGSGGIVVLPFIGDALLLSADYLPAAALFVTVAYRMTTLSEIRHNRDHNIDTDLPTLAKMTEAANAKEHPIVAMQIRNYAAISASFDRDIDAELMQAIIERIAFTEGRPTFHQGEQQLCWLAPDIAINTLEDHLAGLARVLETSVRLGDRKVDLRLAFGIDNQRERPTKTRLASALMAAESAAAEQTLVATYQSDQHDRQSWQLSILGEMDAAIEANEIWVAYQPQLDLRSGHIIGAEALVRWSHPTRGMIPPDEFVKAAEENNRTERLTTFVLATSMQQCRSLTLDGQGFRVAVNISAVLLGNRTDFADYIRAIAATNRFPLDALTLEITETAQIRDAEAAKAALLELAADGVTVAIDDYGTGNASLGYLRSFPASEIKIDKSFIAGMARNARDALLVESTIAMTHKLQKIVVAEGVEDRKTRKMLQEYGCNIIQGYHVGKPQPVDTLYQLVAKQRKAGVA